MVWSKIDLVKIDAESAEKEILLGARRLIEVDKPIITLEMGDWTEGLQPELVICLRR
jgi:hypothetical protein